MLQTRRDGSSMLRGNAKCREASELIVALLYLRLFANETRRCRVGNLTSSLFLPGPVGLCLTLTNALLGRSFRLPRSSCPKHGLIFNFEASNNREHIDQLLLLIYMIIFEHTD
jgi:hypothetical protein